MTENCRKKMAMSLVLTLSDAEGRQGEFLALLPDGSGRDAFAPQLAGQRLFVGRSPLAADLLTGLRSFPENVKTGMVNLSSLQFALLAVFRRSKPISLCAVSTAEAAATPLSIPAA